MSQVMPDGVVPSCSSPSEADQQRGLAALVALAQRFELGGNGPSGTSPVQETPVRQPAWLRADPLDDDRYQQGQEPETDGQQGELAQRSLTDTGALALEVSRLSCGTVVEITRHGPVISRQVPKRRLRKSTFSLMLSRADRWLIGILSLCWVSCLAEFWMWWLEPAHRISAIGTVANSIILFYLTCYPVFFVIAVNRLRNVSPSVVVPLLRVAFIVTRAPSEPWDVASATLTAMLDQDFPIPYDVWLADESPTSEILQWCSTHGVIVSTRNGAQKYHRPSWPRRTKCKEGNLAYFYDHWGYQSYDVVAQLDCDHKPAPTYLVEMVRPFADPAVGYVAAPSVCDSNAASSWSARGRLHREASFHGAFQLGHSAGWAPACIGSHYAVRTAALRDIGGLGPELAEDLSTSFLLNAAGWHGVFAVNAEAHGDGPNTFAAMLVQEFQWSKSLMVLLFKLVPENIRRLPWLLRFRFIYALFFYGLLVCSTLGGILLPPTAAITGKPWVNVNYAAFLLHWWSLSFWLIVLTLLLRKRGLLRPQDAPIISWETWLYTLTRWPYIARGICSALIQVVRSRTETFKVTPKGAGGLESLPVGLIVPYITISLVCSMAAIFGEMTNNAVGYVFLCIMGAFLYSFVSILVSILHAREMAVRVNVTFRKSLRQASVVPLVLGVVSVLPAVYAMVRYPAYAENIFRWHWSMFTRW